MCTTLLPPNFLQDHPLNYYIIERGHNSAMGNKVSGIRGGSSFLFCPAQCLAEGMWWYTMEVSFNQSAPTHADANGKLLHMRDIVGDRWYEIAVAACNLYHGMLYAGNEAGEDVGTTMRRLREAALKMAEHNLKEGNDQLAGTSKDNTSITSITLACF